MKKESFHIITDEEFQLFKGGNERIFRKIFNLYHQLLYRFAYSFTKCSFESEEAVQEAFIILYKATKSIKEPAQIYPYLIVITKRTLIKSFRKKVSHAKYSNYLKFIWSESSTCTQEQIALNDLQNIIQSSIDILSLKEREVYTLNKLKGLSYDEISDCTGASRNTIKNQVISASKKIKLKLDKYYLLVFILTYLSLSHLA